MLRVNNIFMSVMGECNPWGQGAWVNFIRFQGCSAGCKNCDTRYSWDKETGKSMEVDDIIKGLNYDCKKVLLTGGEPLEQDHEKLDYLLLCLFTNGFSICMETNGLNSPINLKRLNFITSIIMDYKLPSSGNYSNAYEVLNWCDYRKDYLKFVIEDERDFNEAYAVLSNSEIKNIYFSACEPVLKHETLFKWMKESKLFNVGLNVQLHKHIFEDWRTEEK